MEKLTAQFDEALSNCSVRRGKTDLATTAHREVRDVLSESPKLTDAGIETVLIGSYARQTGIFPGKDVDVFAKLTALDTDSDPAEIHGLLFDVLQSKYGERAVMQNRSIRIDFCSEDATLGVDVVPAVHSDGHWAIPSRDRELWASKAVGERWVETDPERLTSLTQELNAEYQVSGRGAYVPVVRLVRQIREHHLAESKPGGFYFELLAFWTFSGGVEGDSFAEILESTLRGVASRLNEVESTPLKDPALGSPYTPAPEAAELMNAGEVFERLHGIAEDAMKADKCPAAASWRRIVGRNSMGWCFPLPDGCDEDGRKLESVTAIRSRGPKESPPFA